MENNNISGILWRRLKYQLCPQLDIYKHIAPRVSGKRVWEVGFGTGLGTVQLAAKAKSVYATEIDPLAVDFAKEVFALPNITWMLGDVTESNTSNTHDVIVCLEVLEHISKWQSALRNMSERLTSDGVLIISGPNANAGLRKNDKHEREWTADEFRDALGKYFSEVSLWDYTLSEEQGMDTRVTPIIAVCKHGKAQE